jgi:hypothetical protein
MKAYLARTDREGPAILISIPDLGIVTEAERLDDVLAIAKDAVSGYLSTAQAAGIPVPPPTFEADDFVVFTAVSDLVRWGDPIVFEPKDIAAA